jgi:hypothetical protein
LVYIFLCFVLTRIDLLSVSSNLQGIILGVGLSMLEKAHYDQNLPAAAAEEEQKTRETKRRKTDEGSTPSIPLLGSRMKSSSKGGIGYAGDQKEDVK